MKTNKLFYILHSGKKNKLLYYMQNYVQLAIPRAWFRMRLKHVFEEALERPDYDYIKERVDYYNKLEGEASGFVSNAESVCIGKQSMCRQKVYFFDSYIYTRWFPENLKWKLCPGDITYVPEIPSVVKSRPIVEHNENSVVMKLNKIRHFIFVNDRKSFSEKKDMAVFRGKVGAPGTKEYKEKRYRFMKMYWQHPMCDAGEIAGKHNNPQWLVPKMTIREHLDYKFILAIEGNDVSTNLKWVMSSNSLAVMPRPCFETWFMEGKLIPNYHYVEIKDDFSDLEERMNYYISHPEEAQAIIDHAHEFVAQFKDKRRERLISLLVLGKYFHKTGQVF